MKSTNIILINRNFKNCFLLRILSILEHNICMVIFFFLALEDSKPNISQKFQVKKE